MSFNASQVELQQKSRALEHAEERLKVISLKSLAHSRHDLIVSLIELWSTYCIIGKSFAEQLSNWIRSQEQRYRQCIGNTIIRNIIPVFFGRRSIQSRSGTTSRDCERARAIYYWSSKANAHWARNGMFLIHHINHVYSYIDIVGEWKRRLQATNSRAWTIAGRGTTNLRVQSSQCKSSSWYLFLLLNDLLHYSFSRRHKWKTTWLICEWQALKMTTKQR